MFDMNQAKPMDQTFQQQQNRPKNKERPASLNLMNQQQSRPNEATTTTTTTSSIPLAFPPTYNHHLAKLTADQQNYLLQQQHALVLTIDQMSQNTPTTPVLFTPTQIPTNEAKTPMNNPHQQQQQIMSSSSSSSNSSTDSPIINKMQATSQVFVPNEPAIQPKFGLHQNQFQGQQKMNQFQFYPFLQNSFHGAATAAASFNFQPSKILGFLMLFIK
jgi:hypothetical protein